MTIYLVLGIALAGISVAFALRAAAEGRARSREMLAQVRAYGFEAAAVAAEPALPKPREVVGRVASATGAVFEQKLGRARGRELRAMLDSAGLYRTSVAGFLGYRLLATAVIPVAVLSLAAAGGGVAARAVLAAACCAGLGWVAPAFLVKRMATRRLDQIDYDVPELVDLLVTTVEAGVGFVAALQQSARRLDGPLGQELRLALREQSMGLTIEEALANTLARADSGALRAFVQAILQGETLGVSIGRILRELAVDMRKRRRQAAEERAHKAPTKILFPLVGLIFPALFIVTLGPLVLSFLHALGGA